MLLWKYWSSIVLGWNPGFSVSVAGLLAYVSMCVYMCVFHMMSCVAEACLQVVM